MLFLKSYHVILSLKSFKCFSPLHIEFLFYYLLPFHFSNFIFYHSPFSLRSKPSSTVFNEYCNCDNYYSMFFTWFICPSPVGLLQQSLLFLLGIIERLCILESCRSRFQSWLLLSLACQRWLAKFVFFFLVEKRGRDGWNSCTASD